MATETNDSSVVLALSELVRMESARMESERERAAKRLAEERAELERVETTARDAERVRLERAATEARVAEAEARLGVEADRERDQRIASMRAELARVEADRVAMRTDLERRILGGAPAPRASGWALAFGLSSLVAASLAGLLVMQQSTHAAALPAIDATPHVVAAAPEPVISAPVVTADLGVADPTPSLADTTPPRRRGRRDHARIDTSTHHDVDLSDLPIDDGDEPVSDTFLHAAEQR